VSKFYFDFLKRKLVVDWVLSIRQANDSLAKDPFEIKGMFNSHFQTILLLIL
jgi:hypothetical protein